MLAMAETIIYSALAIALVYIACDEFARWWHERRMRKLRKEHWRSMCEKFDYWQRYDREFGERQRKIRGEG